ncbi:hypothetical protein [Jiangella sp. DSM 45060]|uniref:hypothetical protein n=1 Tax=Jiangella sp. DSM 45060 TaxID=1798224 RepID=UPI0012FDBC9A|nr:hypothetical protein [Jiangella sp. DSM 45060]
MTSPVGGVDHDGATDSRATAEINLWSTTMGLTFDEERFRPLVARAAERAVRHGVRLGQSMHVGPTGLELALVIDDPEIRRIALEREPDDASDYLRRVQPAIRSKPPS